MPKISMTPLRSMNKSTVSRRRFVAGLAAVPFVSVAGPLNALTEDQAQAMIREVTGNVTKIINSGKSESAMIRDFQGIFTTYADVPRIAATLLGPPWRSASSAERSAYVQALTGYLARKYGKQFRQFKGARISLNTTQDLGRKGVIVGSTVKTDVFAPFPVEWHVIEAGGNRRFFDLIIEGVRLIATERSEIRALLDQNRGSIGGLTSALNKRG